MPQGGVDKMKIFYKLHKRELKEETSIKSVKLIKEIDGWFTYDFTRSLDWQLFGKVNLGVKNKNGLL